MTMWTPQKAADETGVSRSTIMRKIKAGAFPNAEMIEGTWQIPVTDLGAAGLRPGRPAPPDHEGDQTGDREHVQDMTDQVTILTTQLAEERQRRAVAEAIAQERERTIEALTETISDYRRMLPAGQSSATGEGKDRGISEQPEPSSVPPVVEPTSILRRMFRRWL